MDEVGRGAWAGPLSVGAAVLPREQAGVQGPRLEDAHAGGARADVRPHRVVVRHVGRRARVAGRVRHARACQPRSGSPPTAPSRASGSGRSGPCRARRQVGLRPPRHDHQARQGRRCACLSIAAASILAKVTRDRIMQAEAPTLPRLRLRAEQGLPVPAPQGRPAAWGPPRSTAQLGLHGPPALDRGRQLLRPEQAQLFEA